MGVLGGCCARASALQQLSRCSMQGDEQPPPTACRLLSCPRLTLSFPSLLQELREERQRLVDTLETLGAQVDG